MTRTCRHLLTCAGCAVLLLIFLLLPLVSLKSYQWGIGDVLHKMPRLVSSTAVRTMGYVLLALMALSPLLMLLRRWAGAAVERMGALLSAASSLLLVVALLLSSRPVAPAVGLWLYLALALAMSAMTFWKKPTC